MENQSGPFTNSDTIAIIVSMRTLGLDIFLSDEFHEENSMCFKLCW